MKLKLELLDAAGKPILTTITPVNWYINSESTLEHFQLAADSMVQKIVSKLMKVRE